MLHILAIIALVIFVLRVMSSKHTDQNKFRHLLGKALAWAAGLALVFVLLLIGWAWYVNATDVWHPPQGQYHYHPYVAPQPQTHGAPLAHHRHRTAIYRAVPAVTAVTYVHEPITNVVPLGSLACPDSVGSAAGQRMYLVKGDRTELTSEPAHSGVITGHILLHECVVLLDSDQYSTQVQNNKGQVGWVYPASSLE